MFYLRYIRSLPGLIGLGNDVEILIISSMWCSMTRQRLLQASRRLPRGSRSTKSFDWRCG